MYLKIPSLKVLIFEPDSEKATLLENELHQLKIKKIKQVSTADEAEKELQKGDFHLLILGKESETPSEDFFKQFEARPCLKKIAKISYSSTCEPITRKELQIIGFVGCIPKPPSEATISQALKNFLRIKNRKDINDWIKNSSFFEEFNNTDFKELVKMATPRIYESGDVIVKQGEMAKSFYILIKGKVEVLTTKNNEPRAHFPIPAGEPFGELAIIENAPRSAFCVPIEKTLLLEIDEETFRKAPPELQLKVMTKIAYYLSTRFKDTLKKFGPQEKPSTYLKELANMVLQNISAKKEAEEAKKEVTGDVPQNVTEGKESAGGDIADYEDENSDLKKIKQMILDEKPAEEEEEAEEKNPFAAPTGTALEILTNITDDQFEVLTKKIHLRTGFILKKIPSSIIDIIRNKLFGYWTGGKLAKYNPHYIWPEELFNPGTPRLKRALHLVVACNEGEAIYEKAYLKLPFSHKIIGYPQTGFTGTFLGTEESIARYLDGECLSQALNQDLNLPIDRLWNKKESIEYLTHTLLDVRDETLFLVFDSPEGELTRQFRTHFPQNQILTVIRNYQFDMENLATMFTQTEDMLKEEGLLVPKKEDTGRGFYMGETLFLPDLSAFYSGNRILKMSGYIFGLIGLIGQIGPDYSGMIWGSSGGAEGAVRAAKALFGMKGAQNSEDLSNAINWADS